MSIFNPVVVSFRGNDYSVPANGVLGLIAAVEDEITISELYSNPKNTAVAKAYAAAIRYAGGSATVSEVYEELFNMKGKDNIRAVIQSLILMMVPPKHLQEPSEGVEEVKKPAKKKPAKQS